MKIDWMQTVLAVALVVMVVTIWRAHRRADVSFDLADLIMVDGKVDRIASSYMLVLAVTTWIMIDLEIQKRMTEGYLMAYGGMWVLPLVAKMVFNKADMPGTTVQSITTSSTTTVKEPAA